MAWLLVWASAAPAVLAASGLERRGASRARPAAVNTSEALPPPTVPLLPTHVGVVGGDDAWQLFDGDGATALEAQGGVPRQIWLGFDRPRLVRELWVDAASEGVVGVELEDEAGKRWPIPGLEQVSLRRGEAPWHKLSVDAPVPVRALALTWLPAGPDARLGELRVRGPGDTAPAARPITEQLYAGVSSGLSVHEGEPRATTIARAHLGASPGHRVVVPLAQDPRAFERAYLVYELSGLASWVEVPRRLNGIATPEPAAPRARAAGAGGWHQQVEEVATGWLRRGDNVLEFSPVGAAVAAEYGVRNVRLVGVPRGTDAIVRLEPGAGEGVQTSAGGLRFDAPTRVSALAFHLPSRSEGVLRLFTEAAGRSDHAGERPLLALPLAGLSPGWQRVALNEPAALRSLRAEVDVRGEGTTAPTALRLESHEALPAQGAARLAVLYAPPGECRSREAMVSGRVEFDLRGRLAAQGQPVFDPSPPETFVDIPLKNPTRYAYDVLSRERRVELPDGAVTATDHDFGALEGATWLRTTLTDAKGTRSIEYADAGGRTVAVQEPGSVPGHPGPIVTRYEHDPLDQLVRVKDAEGNVTSVEYDTLGRRVALTNPDAGRSEWRYDLGGDLGAFETARLRALGQVIRYHYAFHRLERVDFPDGTAPVVYEYGGPELAGDAEGNRAGRIVRESSESGTRESSYDRFGRVARESFEYITMRGEGHGPFRAAFEYEHDAFGRLLELRYPGLGDEIVRYGYDRGGELSSVAGDSVRPTPPGGQFHTDYLKHIGYDEFGERVRVVAGNGITTRYAYEPLRRHLERVEADYHDPFLQQHGLPPRPMQRLHYQFDLAGNLLEARNDVPPDDLPNAQVTIGPTLHAFAYDERYQLTSAEGLYQTRDDRRFRYSFTQQYDALGNLLRKTQMSVEDKKQGDHWNAGKPDRDLTYDAKYAYRGPRPHAPTEIVEKGPPPSQPEKHTFAYDEDGQQVEAVKHQGDRRRLTWDAAGRVKQIDRNGQALSRALYGAKGERTHHLSLGEETVYFNQYLTERFGQYPTKHIYAGGERIASKVDPEWLGQAPTLYYHPDLLGSTHYVTNDEQELVQHAEYFPGGELWADEVNGSYQQRRPAYLFTGKELDEATGLYYYGARYYDARQGQWLSPDPALGDYAPAR